MLWILCRYHHFGEILPEFKSKPAQGLIFKKVNIIFFFNIFRRFGRVSVVRIDFGKPKFKIVMLS